MTTTAPPLKKTLRQQLRQARNALSPQQQARAAQALCQNLHKTILFKHAKTIAVYLPNDGEISPLPLIRLAQKLGKQIYLPVITTNKSLIFRRYAIGDRLQKHRLGVAEPLPRSEEIPVAELDLVLLPLVGFDHQGRRLGMGGGFYDRTFAKLGRWGVKRPTLVGIAHECQQLPITPCDTWDVGLDGIASDTALMGLDDRK